MHREVAAGRSGRGTEMIKIENTEVFGWEAAIRGMRNPMNSWDKSDSVDGCGNEACSECGDWYECHGADSECIIGENDLKLMKNLSFAGNDHGKFLRMINVTMDVTAPLYWWKEFDTYKVGTVANSCSTMHKIHAKRFEVDDFSHEHLISEPLIADENGNVEQFNLQSRLVLEVTIAVLNTARDMYLKTKDKKYWWQMIQLLPSSYNQKRTVQLNYQVLKSMYHARKNHKLDCWHDLCRWCEGLPYFTEICLGEKAVK